ncbi:MAG: threonine/serine dehydratase [Pseudomonadota bacterium]|nr:threonine/serine dehydratase [Pseudomonadota bacterium]
MNATLDLEDIRSTARRIQPYVSRTPIFCWQDRWANDQVDDGELHLKLEFLQKTGSFKARGAINNILTRPAAERDKGVTAASAGNHAIAVAYAGQALGVSTKVVMHRGANPARVTKCRSFGAEVVLVDDMSLSFPTMEEIASQENRSIIHPFEGIRTMQGTATVGLEIAESVAALDAVIVAVGGGGLISGVGTAIKAVQPSVRVIGVEPVGAAGMSQSLKLGRPLEKVSVDTIADSMGAPLHCPESFAVCQKVVDEIVLVDDDALCQSMAVAFDGLKFTLEAAGVAVLAALAGPLKDQLTGQRVAALLCGSNIDETSWLNLVERGRRCSP